MADDPTSRATSPLEVRLELTGSVATMLARFSSEARQKLGFDIERAFSRLLDTLGISGPVSAVVGSASDFELTGGHFFRLRVNGRICRYSDDLLQSVHSYVTGGLLDPRATPKFLEAWLGNEAGEVAYREFLMHASVEAVKEQAGILLTRARVLDYLASVPELTSEDASALTQRFDVHAMLSELLDLSLSLADVQTIGKLLRRYQEQNISSSDIVEALIEKLRPDRIELRMPMALMRELTAKWDSAEPEKFRLVRDGLFAELGVVYPEFAFAASDELKPGTFAFTINHLTTLPFVALQPPRLLVSAPDVTGSDAEPAAIPAMRKAGTVVSSADREELESRGLVVWDAVGYFILCLADALRARPQCFLDRRTVEGNLELLERHVPALVSAARLRLTAEDIARVVRTLAAEQIPLHNLPAILEALLQCDYGDPVPIDAANEAARVALRRRIADKYTRGASTLVVYLLDEAIEAELARGVALSDGDDDRAASANGEEQILAAVRKELGYLLEHAPTATAPHLLTRPELRLSLHRLVAREFPRLSVLSFAEVPATTNIQPVARIAF